MVSRDHSWARLALLFVVLTTCVGCDQLTKRYATEHLSERAPMSFLADTVRIHYVENPGAFLGAGGSLSPSVRFWLLTVLNAVFLFVIAGILIAKWRMQAVPFVAFALLLGGGIGNLIDRVMRDGLVIDFINMGIGPLRTGIFNVADVAISTGFVIVLVQSWRAEPSGTSPTDSP